MKNKKTILIILGIIIIILDQLTKNFLMGKNVIIIPNVLNFTYTENTGAAFGMGSNKLWMIIIMNIIILGIIIKFIRDKQDKINLKVLVPLVLILSGGIGNLIDRISRGYVVDFIDVNLFSFPNFNIADISITIGIILLMIIISKSLFIKNDEKWILFWNFVKKHSQK